MKKALRLCISAMLLTAILCGIVLIRQSINRPISYDDFKYVDAYRFTSINEMTQSADVIIRGTVEKSIGKREIVIGVAEVWDRSLGEPKAPSYEELKETVDVYRIKVSDSLKGALPDSQKEYVEILQTRYQPEVERLKEGQDVIAWLYIAPVLEKAISENGTTQRPIPLMHDELGCVVVDGDTIRPLSVTLIDPKAEPERGIIPDELSVERLLKAIQNPESEIIDLPWSGEENYTPPPPANIMNGYKPEPTAETTSGL